MFKYYSGRLYIVGFAAFFWGWFYYLVSPVIASDLYIRNGFPLYKDLQSLLLSIDHTKYWTFCISLPIAFFVGLHFPRIFPDKYRLGILDSSKGISSWIILLIIIVQFICYYQLRDSLFRGYGGINWDEKNSFKSFISGLNITLGVVCLINIPQPGSKKALAIFALALNSIVLLGMGGRMYVVSSVITILMGQLITGRWKLKKIILLVSIGFILMLAIGLLRQGTDITGEGLSYIFLGEAVLNWVGGANFWVMNPIGYFEMPYGIIASIFGMIPTFLWSGKSEYLSQLDSGFYVDNPVGGTNILVSLLSNFGYVGSAIAILAMGIFTGFVARLSRKNYLVMCIFSVHLALLAFMFFRDSFAIHQKTLVVNAILLPIIGVQVTKILRFRR